MENTDFPAISEKLSQPLQILITTHTNPDGDAIGSSLALAFYLKKKNHRVHVMAPDPFPDFLAWMPGHEDILFFSRDQEKCISVIQQADMIIAADYNNFGRLNDAAPLVRQSKAVKVLIDHHLNASDEFDYKISISRISSTSELVYNFVEAMGDVHLLDKNIAECIYTGIITDTGSLSYACNYVKTYLIIAELFRLGIEPFLRDFDLFFAKLFDGPRQDSGNPVTFAEKMIKHYRDMNITIPITFSHGKTAFIPKTIVFSDSIDSHEKIDNIEEAVFEKILSAYGIGVWISFDIVDLAGVKIKHINMVIKMTSAKPDDKMPWGDCVKLSDSAGKHTGNQKTVELYKTQLGIE